MNFKEIINSKDKAADYIVEEITRVIKTCGKREPGSEGEKKSCEYMAKVLKEDCGCEDVKIESFEVAPRAFYGYVYFVCAFVLLAIAAFFFFPVLSIPLIIAAYTLTIL